jgi:hypothetical protein
LLYLSNNMEVQLCTGVDAHSSQLQSFTLCPTSGGGEHSWPLQTYNGVFGTIEDCRGGLRPPAGVCYDIRSDEQAGEHSWPLQTYNGVFGTIEDCRGGLRPPAGVCYDIRSDEQAGEHSWPLQASNLCCICRRAQLAATVCCHDLHSAGRLC